MNDAMYPKSVAERMMEEIKNDDDSSDGSDSSDYGHDNNEDKYRGNITIQCPADEENGGYEDLMIQMHKI